MNKGLGRREPKNFDHVSKYPLRMGALSPKPVPICIGIPWYSSFDHPVQDSDGSWWIGKGTNLGVRHGGHCVCIPHDPKADLLSWYKYYNQGNFNACVGHGASRMMSLLNRKMYNPWWAWDRAKEIDQWSDTNAGDNEGTSVSAAMDVFRLIGHLPKRSKAPQPDEGIFANVWATEVDQCHSVLQNAEYKKKGAMPMANSWGNDYPRLVWMPDETHARMMREGSEYTLIVDR